MQEALKASTPAAIKRLAELLNCGDPKVELRAAEAILDRTIARAPAPQTLDQTHGLDSPDARIGAIEGQLVSQALAGDQRAAELILGGLAPSRYGKRAPTLIPEKAQNSQLLRFVPLVAPPEGGRQDGQRGLFDDVETPEMGAERDDERRDD
jgi:hypothetical protein